MKNNRIDFFREAAPYIQLHRGKTFVIAFAGEAITVSPLTFDHDILSAFFQ